VPLGTILHAIGRVTSEQGRTFEGTGELLLPDGRVAVSTYGKYIKRRADQITESNFATEAWFAPDEPTPPQLNLPGSGK
jgi:hypothetical protein